MYHACGKKGNCKKHHLSVCFKYLSMEGGGGRGRVKSRVPPLPHTRLMWHHTHLRTIPARAMPGINWYQCLVETPWRVRQCRARLCFLLLAHPLTPQEPTHDQVIYTGHSVSRSNQNPLPIFTNGKNTLYPSTFSSARIAPGLPLRCPVRRRRPAIDGPPHRRSPLTPDLPPSLLPLLPELLRYPPSPPFAEARPRPPSE